MFRALVAATSMLKMVASGIRCNPMIVPSKSVTAITIRVRMPCGRRIAARVLFAVAIALSMIWRTSAAVNPPTAPAVGATKSPSGGGPELATGPTT